MNRTRHVLWLSVVASMLLLLKPTQAHGQVTNTVSGAKKSGAATVSSEKKASTSEKKPSAHPFHGRLTSIDKVKKSITVGKTTYYVGPETKVKKDGQPAALEEGVIEEQVTGYVKPDENGRMVAST